MDDPSLRRHLDEAGHRYLATLSDAEPEAPVASCPGWDVQRLTDHLGRVHRNVVHVLTHVEDEPLPHAPAGDGVVEWFHEGLAALTETLDREVAAPRSEEPTDTWAGVQPRRFWLRRMAHETTIHAWDLGHAVARPEPIDRHLALDGIDEVLEVFLPHRLRPADAAPLVGTTLHLHATDDDPAEGQGTGEWLLSADADGVHWSHGHGKGDVALRAPARDLLLWTWGRIPSARCEVFGESAVAERWQHALRF